MKPALALTKLVLCTLALEFVAITSFLEIAQAQLSPNIQGVSQQPTPPIPPGIPPERIPKGTRGPCENTDYPFTPILPVIPKSEFSGYTLTGHPSFWFYIPYKTSSVSSGKFSLEDEEGNTFYRSFVKLPNTPGFVSVSIPTAGKPLEKNKVYRWNFTLSCTSPDQEQPPQSRHTGIIQRVDMPALETQLKTATGKKRLNLYMENKIWYDAPTDLATSKDFSQDWGNLLEAMGLEQIAREAIAGSVVPIEKSLVNQNST